MSSITVKTELSTNNTFQHILKQECPSDHDQDEQVNPQNLRFASSDSESEKENAVNLRVLRPRTKRRKLIKN